MVLSQQTRTALHIAASFEELLDLCQFIRYRWPEARILLIPFGGTEEEGITIRDEGDLLRTGLSVLTTGAFGYVHVLETPPRSRNQCTV